MSRTSRPPLRTAAALALLLLPVLGVLAVTWLDVLAYAYTPWQRVGAADVAAAVAATRSRAADDGLVRQRVLHAPSDERSSPEAVRRADRLLAGQRDAGGASGRFAAQDLQSASSMAQLETAALDVPDTYLKAYRATQDRRYLTAAVDYVDAFLGYEAERWIPVGLLFNDHAIAERVYVLADLWDAYVRAGDPDPKVAAAMLAALGRWTHFLASPTFYTFRTNHGFVQNLALMHSGVLFPTVGDAPARFALGRDRALRQLDYYLSDEGVVSEHAAHYHEFGMYLIGMLQVYLAERGGEVPPALAQKYERGRAFLGWLRRGDGSLPRIGNTNEDVVPTTVDTFVPGGRGFVRRPVAEPGPGCAWFPASGYAVWRGGDTATTVAPADDQMVIAWPKLIGGGHFRPMDFTVLFYDRGQDWFTETGNWGEDDAWLNRVRGWDGTNAPQFVGEAPAADTRPRLESWACAPPVRFASLARRAADGAITRQVAQLGPDAWLVVDAWQGNTTRFRERWTMEAGIVLAPAGIPGVYDARSPRGERLRVRVMTAPEVRVEQRNGSLDPFAGWLWREHRRERTDALVVESTAPNGWVATLWSRAAQDAGAVDTATFDWRSVREWSLRMRTAASDATYSRAGDGLDFAGRPVALQVAPGDSPADPRRAALAASVADYPPAHRLLVPYRAKVTLAVVALFVLQVVAWHWARRRSPLDAWVLWGGAACWLAFGAWLELRYFVT